MAATKRWVVFDIQGAGPGYAAIGKKEFKKGNTLPVEEIAELGVWPQGPVYTCKLAQVEAESEEEAVLIAKEAYGPVAGSGGTPNAAKELKFFKG